MAAAQSSTPAPAAGSQKPAATSAATAGSASTPNNQPTDSGITAPTDPNKVVLAVGNDKMTAADFDKWLSAFPPQMQARIKSQPRQFVDQYVNLKVAADEAERRQLDKEPKIHEQLSLQRDQILAQALYQELMTNAKITDADAEKYYNDHKAEFVTAKVHHILIRVKGSPVPLGKDKKDLTDEEALAKAKEVQKRLQAGEDFEKVAKEVSDDTTKNGDLGEVTPGKMVKEFDAAVFSLPVGKISDPVKTQFGYHIIRVDSRKEKTFAEAKPEIEQKLRPELVKKEMDDMRAKANVTVDDQFFRPSGTVTK